MKILLAAVNAKYIHSNLAVHSLRAFAKTFAKTKDIEIEIAEFTINQQTDEILRELYRKKPRVAAFSCYIWNLEMIEKLLSDLPKVLPDTDLWIGGPEVSYDAADFLERHPQVKGVMVGEGEETFAELADWYRYPESDASALASIRGLVCRDANGNILQTPARGLLDLSRIPFPYADLGAFAHRIIYYESSRGCPFSCSYCLSSIDKSVRFRDIGQVKEELQFFLDARVAQVKFVDRTFNCRHSHALEIWRYIREHDNGVTNFHFEIAADLLNAGELDLLAGMRPGLVQLEIGVQSTNPQTLKEIDRVSEFKHLSNVVKSLRAGDNIHLHLDLIAGLPHEDFASFVHSFNDVYALRPEQLQLGFLKVLKGSKMHRSAQKYGLCYRANPMYEVLHTNWISYEELLRLKEVEEMVEVYYNSGQFACTIRRLEEEFAHPFAMFEALARYCGEHGFSGQKQSRMARFEILREFIRSRTGDPAYDELLTYDIYLREKSKSRPNWSADLSPVRERILDFYRREEQERRFLAAYDGYSAKQMMNMTHLEPFHYRAAKDAGRQEQWLLFDYRRRNPLTGDAFVQDVTEYL